MRPIFEQSSAALRTPGGVIEEVPVVRPEARKGRKIMGANQHVDAVDLVEREAIDFAAEMTVVHMPRAADAEALGGERNAPRGSQADLFNGHARALPGPTAHS